MAITYIAAGTFASGVGSISPGLPAGMVAGDFMVMFVENDRETVQTVSGWAQQDANVAGVAASTTGTQIIVYSRVFVAGDTAPTVPDNGDHVSGRIFGFRNVNQSLPFDTTSAFVYAAATAATSGTFGALTCDGSGDVIVFALANSLNQTQSLTTVKSYTLNNVANNNHASGNGGGLRVDYTSIVTPQTFSSPSATFGATSSSSFAGIAIKLRLANDNVLTGSGNLAAPTVTGSIKNGEYVTVNGTLPSLSVSSAGVVYNTALSNVTMPGLTSGGSIVVYDAAYVAGTLPLFNGFAEGTVGLYVDAVLDMPGLTMAAEADTFNDANGDLLLPSLTSEIVVEIAGTEPDNTALADLTLPFGVSFSAVVSDGHDVVKATDPDFIATVPALNRSLAVPGLDRSLTVPGLNRTLQVL